MSKRVVHPCTDKTDGPTTGYMILCPACGNGHRFNTAPGPNGVGGQKPVWGFNGDVNRPTFTPSMLVRGAFDIDHPRAGEPLVCHSFVTDGQIQFLGDCTHELAGQTVPLEPW